MKTKEEKLSYISKWQESELSINEYCRQQNIPASTFRGWQKKLLEPQAPSGWHRAEIAEEIPEKSKTTFNIAVQFSIGKLLTFTFQIDRRVI